MLAAARRKIVWSVETLRRGDCEDHSIRYSILEKGSLNLTVHSKIENLMRIHENRALFVSAQKNAQRRNFELMIGKSSPLLSEKLLAARLVYFPDSSDLLKKSLPDWAFSAPSGVVIDVVSTTAEALEQFGKFISSNTQSEVSMAVGSMGDTRFCDECFADSVLPVFVAATPHWTGFLAELFELGRHSLTLAGSDGGGGIIVEAENHYSSNDTVFEITRWSKRHET
ncbi:MAG: hypothetical protein EOP06_32230 [Proteobacteria bacterium]|nr:MAG: hypothetical protein EOP06_32230 [Pseudomonadota bacterium]